MPTTVVSLDPELVPWAPTEPNIKLRRKHNKVLEAVLPILGVIGLMVAMWLFSIRGTFTKGNGAQNPTAGDAAPVGAIVAGESVTHSLIGAASPSMGQYGAVVFILKKGELTFYCKSYKAIYQNKMLGSGETMTDTRLILDDRLVIARGAVIDARELNPKKITLVCDDKTLVLSP